MPQAYDTPAGEEGRLLPPGVRQRIALARAILRQPAILLLDEPMAALDPESEAAVKATLAALMAGRTSVIVTHRLAAVADLADSLVVLDRGQIVESGSHEELLARKGLYHRLWQLQSGFVVSADGCQAEVQASRLRAIPLFQDLDNAMLEALAGRFLDERYETGQTVITEGTPGGQFHILVRGKVSATTEGYGGRRVEVAILQNGDYFGETELLEGSASPYTVETLLPSLFLTLQRDDFVRLLEERPAVRRQVEDTAMRRGLRAVSRVGRRRSGLSLLDDLIEE